MWSKSLVEATAISALILSSISAFLFYRIYSVIKMLKTSNDQRSINNVLTDLNNHLKESKTTLADLKRIVESHQRSSLKHLQKSGFVRFNPFTDSGGDQSFALAILDGHNDGFVISSLHSRDQTRTFAKPVKAGIGEKFELSKEEKLAIDTAIKSL